MYDLPVSGNRPFEEEVETQINDFSPIILKTQQEINLPILMDAEVQTEDPEMVKKCDQGVQANIIIKTPAMTPFDFSLLADPEGIARYSEAFQK